MHNPYNRVLLSLNAIWQHRHNRTRTAGILSSGMVGAAALFGSSGLWAETRPGALPRIAPPAPVAEAVVPVEAEAEPVQRGLLRFALSQTDGNSASRFRDARVNEDSSVLRKPVQAETMYSIARSGPDMP